MVEGTKYFRGEVGKVANPIGNFIGGGIVDIDALGGGGMVRDDWDEGKGIGGGALELEVGLGEGVIDAVKASNRVIELKERNK